jgi:hypothetical protein
MAADRLSELALLAPRFFHILNNGDGFACGELNIIEKDNLPDAAEVLIENHKVGIWKSVFRNGESGCEAIALWVDQGQIDLTKSTEKRANDEAEMQAKYASDIDKEDINSLYSWKYVGSYCQDGEQGSMIAKSFLTKAAAKEISGVEEDDELDMDGYLETLFLTGMEFETENPDNVGYTIGGLSCESPISYSRYSPRALRDAADGGMLTSRCS